MLVACKHDERVQRPHLLVKQADSIVLGVVGAEAVGADHFCELVRLMCRSAVAPAAHFAEPHSQARLGQLPGSLAARESTADDVNVEGHVRPLVGTPNSVTRNLADFLGPPLSCFRW